MNVSLITMPREEAQAKLKAHRRDRHKDAEDQYRQVAEGYEALAKGLPLIELSRAIAAGGFFPGMRPKLAIARADRREVHFQWPQGRREASYRCGSNRIGSAERSPTLHLFIDMGQPQTHTWRVEGYALVPMVPADVRPEVGQLRDWHILWEVEQWHDKPQHMQPPVDPLLIKHIGGDLWAVLAEWDLTPLEQAVLRNA